MEKSKETPNAENSYAERVIFEEIIANLGGYESDASESQSLYDPKNEIYDETEDPRLRYVMNDHNYMLNDRDSRIPLNLRQNLIDYVKKNSASTCTVSINTPIEKLIDNVLELLCSVTNYDSVIEKIEQIRDPKLEPSIKDESDNDQVMGDPSVEKEIAETVKNIKSELNSSIDTKDAAVEEKIVPKREESDVPDTSEEEKDTLAAMPNCDDKLSDNLVTAVEGDEKPPLNILLENDNRNPPDVLLICDEKTLNETLECAEKSLSAIIESDENTSLNTLIERDERSPLSILLDCVEKCSSLNIPECDEKPPLELIDDTKSLINETSSITVSKDDDTGTNSTEPEEPDKSLSPEAESSPKEDITDLESSPKEDIMDLETSPKEDIQDLESSPNEEIKDTNTESSSNGDMEKNKKIEELKASADEIHELDVEINNEEDSAKNPEIESTPIIEDNSNPPKSPDIPDVIKELLKFADKLKEDCTSAHLSSDDFNLESFIALKSREYKSILSPVLHAEISVQTDKPVSKKKLRKINAQDKRLLLESSNDSDSSASSYIDQSFTELEAEFNSRKLGLDSLDSKKSPKRTKFFTSSDDDSDDESAKSDTSNDTRNSSKNETYDEIGPASDSDKDKQKSADDLPKTNDKQDPIGSHSHKSRGKSTNESDKENRSIVISPEPSLLGKSKQDERVDEDTQDKEIERLLNLKGLADPQKNTSLTLNSKQQKPMSKSSSKTDSLYAVMQEIDKNSLSDDSGNDDSEQILTEKQFLVKCNENLKQQLLNSASSDSDNFNSDVDLDLMPKSNEQSGDEDDNRLSYVDKFLETLDIDNEENSPPNSDLPKKATSPNKTTSDVQETINLTDTNDNSETSTTSLINRDAFGFKRKEISEKSFEAILANDNRQKALKMQEELIELSADSCNSDVEEYPAENKAKSQRIKPMLRHDQLESETIHAAKKEAERLRRLEKRNTFLTKMLKLQSADVNEKDLVLDYASATKKFIKVHPDIVKHLKPHQRDGLKFMYDCCYGCVDALKVNSGSGCILAHCMGLGKTLQIIALLHTVTSYKELKTSKILVLCPKSTIMNWADEIQRWLGPLDVKNLQIFNFSDTADIYEKINVLRQWSASSVKAGCLIMGYEAFRSLVFFHSSKNRTKSTMRIEDIRTNINKYLLKPGADLVVCDEGHIIKNRKSGISLATAEIVTPKRIVLTGTPIQNNLKEYYSMVNFIKPLILGTEKEFANLYANPIKYGQHKDSSKRDIKVMKQRSFVLHKKLSKFVQRKEAELLQSFLPQKYEYVLFIPMTDVQNNLYEYVLEAISRREDSRGRSLITDYTCLRKIWTHPKVLEDAWKNAMAAKNKKEPKKQSTTIPHSDDEQPDDIYDSQTGVISVQHDWWRSLVTDTDLESILPSNKLKTMFEIIRMSEENGEKCLIFSAFVAVLNVVEHFLNQISDKQRNFFMFEMPKFTSNWVNGQDYYRLDGKTNKTLRHEMVKRFNDPKNKRARLFLISAKAGGQGINLIGANRVIILDTSWNPANDQQNIFRIFRLGQKKNCYVYRLIAMGTMEEKVYSRSVTKQAMSFRVVDEQQIDRHYNMAELAELYTLTKPAYNERPVPVFPQDQILANLLLNFPDLVYKYHEHDSLLENKVEQELSEQDKADAWVAYERDLQMNSETREVMEAGYPGQGYPLFNQGNYMYPPMTGFDPNNLAGTYDINQLDLATRNSLGPSLIPDYLVNRNSYLDILNMYKKFSSSLLSDKNNRGARYNPNYGMPLSSMMTNPLMNNSSENHLAALAANPYYPLHSLANTSNAFSSSSLNTNAMMSHPSLPSLSMPSQANAERYEQNKKIIAAEDNIASSLRNYPNPMAAFTKDLTTRPLQTKNLLQSSTSVPPPSPPVHHSPSPQLAQNMFSTHMGNDGIPRNVIQKKRGNVTAKSIIHSPTLDSAAKSKTMDSLPRSASPAKKVTWQDQTTKAVEQPTPVNMGIVYPKAVTKRLSPVTETNEGSRILKSGSSMQIIPTTHSPLTENVRKKFDNISPNISLTAVRTQPKGLQPEQSQTPSSASHLEMMPSNSRKRRNSAGNNTGAPKANTKSAIEQPSNPPKFSKY